MRRYLVALLSVTLALTLVCFGVRYAAPDRYMAVLPLLPLYFGIVAFVQHLLVTKAMRQSPRRFVQIFLATTVGTLFLHMVVIASYVFTHLQQAHTFTLAFGIGFAVYLVFETVALYLLVKRAAKGK